MSPLEKLLFMLQKEPPPPRRGGWRRGGWLFFHQKKVRCLTLVLSKKVHDKVISNLLKSTKTIVLGRGKVSMTLFRSLVFFYVIDAIKSYEGRQDPTHN